MLKVHDLQKVALIIYFFSINFEMYNFLGLGSTSKLAAFFYLFSITFSFKKFLDVALIRHILQSWLIFIVYLTVISFFNVNEYSYTIFDATLILNVILFMFLVNHERLDPGVLSKGLIGFSIGTIALTMLFYLGIGVEYEYNRATMFGDNPNNVGNRLSVALIILLFFSYSTTLFHSKWRILLLLPCPFLFQFLLETGSRKSFIALVLALALGGLFIKTTQLWKKLALRTFLVGIFFYITASLLSTGMLAERLTRTVERGDMAGRDRIWLAILPYIKENFIFGGGLTGFKKYSTQTFGAYNAPHNVIIEVMAYTGIIGLLIYTYFLFKVWRQAYKAYRDFDFMLPALLLIPTVAMILAGHALNSKLAWGIYAFTVGTLFLARPTQKIR